MDVPISTFHDKMIKHALLCLSDWKMTSQSNKSTLQVVLSIIVKKKKLLPMVGECFYFLKYIIVYCKVKKGVVDT